jgi:hypothetical protein
VKFTICGSTRWESAFHEWNKRLGLMGHISYSLTTFPSVEGRKSWYSAEEKELMDLVHLAKIEESDAIFVINQEGYIGESTHREISWAKLRNKKIFYLEPQHFGYIVLGPHDLPGWTEAKDQYPDW